MVGEKFVFAAAFRGTSRRQMRSSWLSSAEEGDSPQCGEMSRRDKRARHPLKMEGKLPSLTKVLIR